MKKLTLLLALCCVASSWAQPYGIGHRTITYNDPARTGGYGSGGGPGRQIQCEVYYPATSTGDNVPFASVNAPVIVFGHGFVMSWDAYENIWDHLVPQGYVMIFPRTEGSISPVHADFGKDLVVAANRFSTDCSDNAFFAYNHWNGKQAVMGHSMGGGSTLLAASDPAAAFDLLVGLAPAETDPSASSTAVNVSIPAAIFSGSGDAVTPPANHHLPIFNGLSSDCKQFFSVSGGAHCYFANSNLACDFGEGSSGGDITISREEQHDILFDGLDPLLDFYLMGNCTAWNEYTAFFSDSRIQTINSCNYTLPSAPTISLNGTMLSTGTSGNLQWYLNGTAIPGETGISVDASVYGNGTYSVVLTDVSGCTFESNEIVVSNLAIGEALFPTQFRVFPVPASESIIIEFKGEDLTTLPQLKLLNLQGIIVDELTLESAQTNYSVTHLASGVYYLFFEKRAAGTLVIE